MAEIKNYNQAVTLFCRSDESLKFDLNSYEILLLHIIANQLDDHKSDSLIISQAQIMTESRLKRTTIHTTLKTLIDKKIIKSLKQWKTSEYSFGECLQLSCSYYEHDANSHVRNTNVIAFSCSRYEHDELSHVRDTNMINSSSSPHGLEKSDLPTENVNKTVDKWFPSLDYLYYIILYNIILYYYNIYIYISTLSKKTKKTSLKKVDTCKEFDDSKFEQFYQLYPRKDNRAAALKVWQKKNLDKHVDKIIEHVTFITTKGALVHRPREFTKLMSTYLNSEEWRDDISQLLTYEQLEHDHGRTETILERISKIDL